MRKSIVTLLLSNGAIKKNIKNIIEENKVILIDKCKYSNESDKDSETKYGNLLLNSKNLLNISVDPYVVMLIIIVLSDDGSKDRFTVAPLDRVDKLSDTITYCNKNSILI